MSSLFSYFTHGNCKAAIGGGLWASWAPEKSLFSHFANAASKKERTILWLAQLISEKQIVLHARIIVFILSKMAWDCYIRT